jgi:outer membrane biosynthesis protein TonB
MNVPNRIFFKLLVFASLASWSFAQQPVPTPEPQPNATEKSSTALEAPTSSQDKDKPATTSDPEPSSQSSQNKDKPAATPGAQPTPPHQPENSVEEQEKEIQKKEQSQRILGVVPQFGVTSREHPAPLTPGQKFHLFTKSSFDPFAYVAADRPG